MAEARRSFGELWPELADRLRVTLVARGVPAQDRDDVVQETALRVYRVWEDLDADRSPWPFVVTVGLNYWRDIVRERVGHATEVAAPSTFELTDRADVERDVLARAELATVGRAMQGLAPEQRRLIFANEEFHDVVRPLEASERMARMRARRQLARAVGRASVAALLVWLRRPARSAGLVATAYATAMATAVFTAPLAPMIVKTPALRHAPAVGTARAHRGAPHGWASTPAVRPAAAAVADALAAAAPVITHSRSVRRHGAPPTEVCSPTSDPHTASDGKLLGLDVRLRSIGIYTHDGTGRRQQLFKTPAVDANAGRGCVAVS